MFVFLKHLLTYSPINDILEKETFSLEEILEEDELLQEAKASNQKLIQL
jgi:serine/threonine-protein phosphatase 6 regulatory subunit 3